MRGVEGYVRLDIAMHYLDSASFHFARNTTRTGPAVRREVPLLRGSVPRSDIQQKELPLCYHMDPQLFSILTATSFHCMC